MHTQRDIARTRAPQPKAFILQQGVDTEKVAAMETRVIIRAFWGVVKIV